MGDIESMVFLEALRQFQFDVGTDNIMFMHVSLVPVLGSVGEQKTKPTQHSVKVWLAQHLLLVRLVINLFTLSIFIRFAGVESSGSVAGRDYLPVH